MEILTPEINLFLVRHGQSSAQLEDDKIFHSRSAHAVLTDLGVLQSQKLGRRWAREKRIFDYGFSSPLLRARHTMRIVHDQVGYPERALYTSPALSEFHRGDWEGRLRADVYSEVPAEQIHYNYQLALPGGESMQSLEDRTLDWLNTEIVGKLGKLRRPINVSAFSHMHAIRALLKGVFGESEEWMFGIRLDNTSITHLRLSNGNWQLVSLNDTEHLAEVQQQSKELALV